MKPEKPKAEPRKSADGARRPDSPHIQGEGDYESAREYNEDLKEFVQSGKVDEAARNAAPRDAREAQDMERAEQAGKARAKEEDPLLRGRKH